MDVIIPAAGKSTRYPDMKPKWLLTQPTGELMIKQCINGLKNIGNIYIAILREHLEKYCDNDDTFLYDIFENNSVHVNIIETPTKSQCETVYSTIKKFCIDGPIFIKDVDNYFDCDLKFLENNSVCYIDAKDYPNIKRLHQKSFLEMDRLSNITKFVEKKIIGENVCVGGYFFKSATKYISFYKKIIEINNIVKEELFNSHIIQAMLLESYNFRGVQVQNYSDWGTYDEWIEYKNSFKTLFVDIDGILFENASEFFEPKWGFSKPIMKNIETLKNLDNEKTQIILTTTRKSKYEKETSEQLKKYNIPYNSILFDMNNCKRYLINDFSEKTNPYPTSISINLKRNSNNLNDLLC